MGDGEALDGNDLIEDDGGDSPGKHDQDEYEAMIAKQ